MKISGPLFKWFGSKWLSSKTLPAPRFDTIIEPFAGGAGYSLRHHERKVILAEIDPHLTDLWRWLIDVATEASIREIPLGLPEGTDIRTLGLTLGQSLLLKTWQRTNNVGSCWTISPWGNKPGQWTANTRARVAEEIGAVKHWQFILGDGIDLIRKGSSEAVTWFVDPPYQFNYQYRGKSVDYTSLAFNVLGLRNHGHQAIVCEALCQKTDARPTWLPFVDFASRITSRRKTENNHHSRELIFEL